MATRFSASQKQKVDIASHPLVQQIDAANRRITHQSKQKDIGKKLLVVTSTLLLAIFGISTYMVLAKIGENHTKSVTITHPTVSTNDTKKVASSVSTTIKANGANDLATTPVLNKQTIVITGDHLKNGVISSASQPYPIDKNVTNDRANHQLKTDIFPAITNKPINTDKTLVEDTGALTADTAIDNQTLKSTVSYDEFVKASETTIYRDNSPSKK